MTAAWMRFFHAIPAKMREEDKRKHFVWSFWLTVAAACVLPLPEAFAAVFAIGLGKEVWDRYYGSGFCLFDIVGNVLGSVLALALFALGSGVLSVG